MVFFYNFWLFSLSYRNLKFILFLRKNVSLPVHCLCLNHSPFLFAISGIWKLHHHTVKPDVDDEKSRICCILLQNNYIFIPTRPHPHPVEIQKGDIADMSYWHCVSEVCNVHPRHFRETRQCRGANFFKQFIFYLPWRIFWAHRFWTADN